MKSKYLFLSFLICFSCNRTKQTNVTEPPIQMPIFGDSCVYYPIKDNRIKVDLNKPRQVSLFDYFSHVELIPLATKDVLIGNCEEVIHYQGRYYVLDNQQHRVYVFDDTGKFIFQINKRGQGPGEYTLIRSIMLNPFTNNIDVLDINSIHSYDLSGKYVRTFPPRDNPMMVNPFNFIALNEKTYVVWTPMTGTESNSYKISYFDINEAKIFHQEYENDVFFNKFLFRNMGSHTPFYEYHEKWFFSHFVDNVTYEVGANSLIKAYTWDFGKNNYDPLKLNLPNDPSSMVTLPYRIFTQMQNNRYLMTLIRLRNNIPDADVLLVFDKSTDECKYIEHFTESVDFLPQKATNEYVLSWCHHGALEKYVSEEMLDETNRQKFRDLMDTKEEMNTIIIKYYFK